MKRSLEAALDVPVEYSPATAEPDEGEDDALKRGANELLAHMRREAATRRWSGVDAASFEVSPLHREEGVAVGLCRCGFVTQEMVIVVDDDGHGTVWGQCRVDYCVNWNYEFGLLEALSIFYLKALSDHVEAFLQTKLEALNALYGPNVWRLEVEERGACRWWAPRCDATRRVRPISACWT